VLRQRQLHQNTIDLGIGIHLANQLHQIFLRRLGGQPIVVGIDAEFFAGPLLGRHIRIAGRIFANQNDTETGHDALFLEFGHFCLEFDPNISRHLLAVNDLCRHRHSFT
jgi:hypothetical protein